MKTSELTGAALDWAVAKCEGVNAEAFDLFYEPTEPNDYDSHNYPEFHYSTIWAHGGPIIERECIDVMFEGPEWYAYMRWEDKNLQYDAPTPLIAAMRCYVASKLGEEVDVPEELK